MSSGTPTNKRSNPLWTATWLLGLYFAINAAIIGVQGNFPLNDDWMYGMEVKHMVETGQLILLGGSPACALHIAVGALACKLFGFSFPVLRAVCVLFAYAACLLLYGISRQLGVGKGDALFGALILASNPLFLNLSFAYMTDIPALTYSFAYMLLFLLGIKRRSVWLIAASGLALIGAVAVRQNYVLFVVSNAVIALILWWRDKRATFAVAAFLVAAPAAWAAYIDKLMKAVNLFPQAYDWYKFEIARLFRMAFHDPYSFGFLEIVSTATACAYLGLFFMPILATLMSPELWMLSIGRAARSSAATGDADNSRWSPANPEDLAAVTSGNRLPGASLAVYALLAIVITLCGTTFMVGFQHRLMPLSPNVLPFPALGSLTIVGMRSHPYGMGNVYLTTVSTVFACALLFTIFNAVHLGIMLSIRFIKRTHQRAAAKVSKHTAMQAAAFIFTLLVFGQSFAWAVFHSTIANLDRYFLAPFAFGIPCLLATLKWLKVKAVNPATCLLAIITALYSACAQYDYLTWNRIRWQALDSLEQRGISFKDVDGGAEYNYWKDPALSNDITLSAETFRYNHRGTAVTSRLRGWSINGEKYLISSRELPSYQLMSSYQYWSPLSLSVRSILVLRTTDPAAP